MKKVRQTAEEARQLLLKHIPEHFTQLEVKLSQLTEQLRESRDTDDFSEIDFDQWKERLAQLTEELSCPSSITLQQDSTPLVAKISVDISSVSLRIPNIRVSARWIQDGTTVAGGDGYSDRLNHLCYPLTSWIDDDQAVYIVDQLNDRIVGWKREATYGQLLTGGNGQGNRLDQLNVPISIFVDQDYSLYVTDQNNHRVQKFDIDLNS